MAHLRNLLDRHGRLLASQIVSYQHAQHVITGCRQDVRLGLIHKFLWDRYRSVRQDLYIQGIDVSKQRGVAHHLERPQACCGRNFHAFFRCFNIAG
jgi:hypothetical protein